MRPSCKTTADNAEIENAKIETADNEIVKIQTEAERKPSGNKMGAKRMPTGSGIETSNYVHLGRIRVMIIHNHL